VGTLFRLFPQVPTGPDSMPAEIVEVSSPVGSIGAGPRDERMHVVFPCGKDLEYGMHIDDTGVPFVYLPPWTGQVFEPALPGADGHFLHYDDIEDPRFHAAHTFGAVRFTLDVWEHYYGCTIPWYFEQHYETAEIVIIPEFDNAQIGRGFIELGAHVDPVSGTVSPFTMNFDVIAHEVGHGIAFAAVGEPEPDKETGEFLGFQESSADLVSMIAILHFDSVIDQVLESTSGNLYLANHLNRFAELSPVEQIRMASNSSRLSDFEDGWKDSHRLGQPLTGAVFDIFIDIFHEELVAKGAISNQLEEMSDKLEGSPEYEKQLQDDFERAYSRAPDVFRQSLIFSRDTLAILLIETWALLTPDYFRFTHVHSAMCQAEKQLFDLRYNKIINVNFQWREIGTATVGPQLPKDKNDDAGHIGHKDTKHKFNGLNEPLADPSLSGSSSKRCHCHPRGYVRVPYAKRYKMARVDAIKSDSH